MTVKSWKALKFRFVNQSNILLELLDYLHTHWKLRGFVSLCTLSRDQRLQSYFANDSSCFFKTAARCLTSQTTWPAVCSVCLAAAASQTTWRRHVGCRVARKEIAAACGQPRWPASHHAAGADAGRAAATRPACMYIQWFGKRSWQIYELGIHSPSTRIYTRE
jgi:hypothetical protein